MALGTFTEKQWEELKKRDIARLAPAERDGFLEEAQVLCAKNEDLLDHNINGIKKCETDVAPISALHTGLGKYADINSGGGLPKETILCKGAKVVLLSNEWKEAGKNNTEVTRKKSQNSFSIYRISQWCHGQGCWHHLCTRKQPTRPSSLCSG